MEFERELQQKHLKIVNSSNRSIWDGKWNVIDVSSGKHLPYVEEGSWPQEIYVHFLQAKNQ